MKENKEILRCSICGDIIEPNGFGWKYGNKAQPVSDGRCCDRCNLEVVIPMRINYWNIKQ